MVVFEDNFCRDRLRRLADNRLRVIVTFPSRASSNPVDFFPQQLYNKSNAVFMGNEIAVTMSITIEEVTTNLLDLLDRVSKGEEITILKDGQEIARLVPPSPVFPPRVPGTAAGMITIAPDFDDPLPDDILAAFEA